MRRVARARRAADTTSCEVIPDGLSTSSRPSIARPSAIGRPVRDWRVVAAALLLNLREQRFDSRRTRDALVELETDLGRQPKPEGTPDARPEVARDARETIERGRALRLASQDTHVDFRVTQVARHIDAGNGHEAHDARILHAFREEHRNLFADGFGNAVWATIVVRHDDFLRQRHMRDRVARARHGPAPTQR